MAKSNGRASGFALARPVHVPTQDGPEIKLAGFDDTPKSSLPLSGRLVSLSRSAGRENALPSATRDGYNARFSFEEW